MTLVSWLRNWSWQRTSWLTRRHPRPARPAMCLLLEILEDRYLPSGYTITDLGTLGGPNSSATRINSSGEVIGYSDTASGDSHAFLYDGSMHDLGTLGGTTSEAEGINDAGQVVGAAYTTATTYHAFLYDGSMHDLGTLGGANAINNSGQIVGFSKDAILWQNGTMTDLGTLGGNSSDAIGINDSGQIVGVADTTGGSGQNGEHAFLYDGSMHDLGTLGGNFSQADDINDSGQIVGYSKLADNTTYNAFLYDGSMHALGTLGGWFSQASAINDLGQIVGFSNLDLAHNASGRFDAFLYENGTMIDLNSLLPAGSDFAYLHYATGINDRGQIAGEGITTGGQTHAYLLTPLSQQPTLNVTDGGTYASNPLPATATAVGADGKTAVSGTFSYNYYVGSGTSGMNLGSTPPTNVGTYTVVATFTSNDINYASGGTAQNTFTINPAQLTVTAVALNKPSDGTTTGYAILSDTPLGNDHVTAIYTSATFAGAGPGKGITVTVSGISLMGSSANNYTPANSTATSTANIVNTTNPVTTLDSQKRLIGIVYTGGNVYERVYNPDGTSAATLSNPTTGTIRSGVILDAYGYTASGQYTSVVEYSVNGNVFNRTYNYDTNGNLTDSFATLTNPITNTVIPNVTSQDWTYNAAGKVTIQHNFNTNGNVYTRTYQFDMNGNVTGSTATLFDSSNTKLADYTYGAAGNLTDYKAYSANGNVYEITYNPDGTSKATLTNSGGPVSPNVTSQDWFYNAAGKVTSQDNFYTNGNVYTRTYQFDNNGNTTGSTATLTNSGGPVSPGVTKDSYSYNVAGQTISVVATYTNGNVFTRTFNHDNSGNLTGSTATTVSGGATQTTLLSYTYDAQNRITSLTVGANSNTLNYSYDPNTGLLTQATLKDQGGNTVATYTYTQGQLSSVTYAAYNNEVVSYTYDSNGVLLSTKLSDSSNHPISSTNYNAQGQITIVDDSTGALSATYTYDAQGRISNIAYVNGNNLSYSYTGNGSAATLTLTNNGTTLQTEALDVYGRLTQVVFYTNNSPNGNVYNRTFDSDGDGTSYATLTNSSSTVLEYYEYDAQGNLTYGPSPTQPMPWPPT